MAEASAPASSANLGPGFDCLAVALEIRCAVRAEPADAWTVSHVGADAPPEGADDAVLIAAQTAVGADRPLALVVDNAVPIGRGLGSSSAAAAAGAVAAWKAHGENPSLHRAWEIATDMDGHPDNAAAAVYGGLVLATAGGAVHRLPWNVALHAVVAVPNEPFRTAEARRLLPVAYEADVVRRSLARVAALVAGLVGGDTALLADASGDEIHERPRQEVRPDVAELIDVARSAGAVHAAWSGAGPSMLALVPSTGVERVRMSLERCLADRGRVLAPGIATTGVV
ncbi:MAG TPA: homoserine kinase [Acidimicrobiia bacterium]|nr:homoserine kinase [Acidimicrobiia bacterium]